ncbi:MAG: 30S ribosomal protein S9, partial [Firmicutes bacterium]|nr:30S ribosomal protein S9 [Bacillota bacterium]
MAKMQYYGTGRRKSSVARVRLVPGKGNIIVNKKTLDDYFGGLELLKNEVKRPLQITGAEGKFDVIATVKGGGTAGQSGALRHGVSRALCQADP